MSSKSGKGISDGVYAKILVGHGAKIRVQNHKIMLIMYIYIYIHQHLQRGAKWFLKGVNSPSLRVNWHPFEGPGILTLNLQHVYTVVCPTYFPTQRPENVKILEPTKLPVFHTSNLREIDTETPEAKADKLGPDVISCLMRPRSRLLLTVKCDAWVNSKKLGDVVKICVCRQMETFSS